MMKVSPGYGVSSNFSALEVHMGECILGKDEVVGSIPIEGPKVKCEHRFTAQQGALSWIARLIA